MAAAGLLVLVFLVTGESGFVVLRAPEAKGPVLSKVALPIDDVSSSSSSSPQHTETSSGTLSEPLRSILCKPSRTLAVVLDVVSVDHDDDYAVCSMQLRKHGASALLTRDPDIAAALIEEQKTAQGCFPGPCPVVLQCAASSASPGGATAGLAAVIVPPPTVKDAQPSLADGVDRIYQVASLEDVALVNGAADAYYVEIDSNVDYEATLAAIPENSVLIVGLSSMQQDNMELQQAHGLQKEHGVTAVVLRDAIVGDAEDIDYSSFVVKGLTRKKSKTFNMTGLTGSVNGHFGGVASKQAQTWRRTQVL